MNYKHFSEEELTCNCGCGEQDMDSSFMKSLDSIREELGFPLIVTSAYRCPSYNDQVSSTGKNGPHTTGKAIDIAVSHEKAFLLLKKAFEYGFTGIGVNQKGEHRFIHLDSLDQEKYPRPRVWSYK